MKRRAFERCTLSMDWARLLASSRLFGSGPISLVRICKRGRQTEGRRMNRCVDTEMFDTLVATSRTRSNMRANCMLFLAVDRNRKSVRTRKRVKRKAHQGTQALEFSFIPTREDLFVGSTITSSSSSSSSSIDIGVGLADFIETCGRSH